MTSPPSSSCTSSSSRTRPRPIHAPHRSLTSSPDPNEPANSYPRENDSEFLNDSFMLAEFDYHNDAPLQQALRKQNSGLSGSCGSLTGLVPVPVPVPTNAATAVFQSSMIVAPDHASTTQPDKSPRRHSERNDRMRRLSLEEAKQRRLSHDAHTTHHPPPSLPKRANKVKPTNTAQMQDMYAERGSWSFSGDDAYTTLEKPALARKRSTSLDASLRSRRQVVSEALQGGVFDLDDLHQSSTKDNPGYTKRNADGNGDNTRRRSNSKPSKSTHPSASASASSSTDAHASSTSDRPMNRRGGSVLILDSSPNRPNNNHNSNPNHNSNNTSTNTHNNNHNSTTSGGKRANVTDAILLFSTGTPSGRKGTNNSSSSNNNHRRSGNSSSSSSNHHNHHHSSNSNKMQEKKVAKEIQRARRQKYNAQTGSGDGHHFWDIPTGAISHAAAASTTAAPAGPVGGVSSSCHAVMVPASNEAFSSSMTTAITAAAATPHSQSEPIMTLEDGTLSELRALGDAGGFLMQHLSNYSRSSTTATDVPPGIGRSSSDLYSESGLGVGEGSMEGEAGSLVVSVDASGNTLSHGHAHAAHMHHGHGHGHPHGPCGKKNYTKHPHHTPCNNNNNNNNNNNPQNEQQRVVHQLLDKTVHSRYKKKLVLANLNMSAKDIPVDAICSRPLGESLHKLSLAGNRLLEVPAKLVLELQGLHTLDLQQCDLTCLPKEWRLMSLRRLILSHNKLQEFLDETMLKGLPELRHLDMYDNKLCEVTLPGQGMLAKLEFLNLGFNNLVHLPDDLPQLRRLKVLKVTNNLITHIPKRVVCDMDLKELEVTPNPLIQPPVEDCERGLNGMRRYYRCLAVREPGGEFMGDSPASSYSGGGSGIKGIRRTLNVKRLKSKGRKDWSNFDDMAINRRGVMRTLQSKLNSFHSNVVRSRSTSTSSSKEPPVGSSSEVTGYSVFDDALGTSHSQTDPLEDAPSSSLVEPMEPLFPNLPDLKKTRDDEEHDVERDASSIFRDPPRDAAHVEDLSDKEEPPRRRLEAREGMEDASASPASMYESRPTIVALPPKPAMAVEPLASAQQEDPIGERRHADGEDEDDVASKGESTIATNATAATAASRIASSLKSSFRRAKHSILEEGGTGSNKEKDLESALRDLPDARLDRLMERDMVNKVLDNAYPDKASSKDAAQCDKMSMDEKQQIRASISSAAHVERLEEEMNTEEFAVNDTLKIIFVGMAYTGKTSIIRRLKYGGQCAMPKREERTVGVDIYEWDPKVDLLESPEGIVEAQKLDTRVKREDGLQMKEADVKFSVWDFAGQNVYHATHELFFSPRALYVVVWDMAANNSEVQKHSRSSEEEDAGPFALSDDSSDDDEQYRFVSEQDSRRFERALERDIDEKVQFWVDCIQSNVPGAAILPVASFDDKFDNGKAGGLEEARRRCSVMRRRLLQHEERRKEGLARRLEQLRKGRRANTEVACRLRKLLTPFARPKLLFDEADEEAGGVLRVSCTSYRGFESLRERIVNISTGREHGEWSYPIFRGHVGAVIPRMRLEVRDVVRRKRKELKVVEWGHFLKILKDSMRQEDLRNAEDVSDALHFLSNTGELSYFGGTRGSSLMGEEHAPSLVDEDDEDEDEEEEREDRILAIDNFDNDPYSRFMEDSEDEMNDKGGYSSYNRAGTDISGLSDYVFLNPRWLVAVVACILRHDLRQEIDDTKRNFQRERDYEVTGDWQNSGRPGFHEANLNCPIITAEDACMLWKTKKIIVKAAERAKNESSSATTLTAFEFLQRLLVKFSVFVPIDLNIDRAIFGGEEYGKNEPCNAQDGEVAVEEVPTPEKSKYFFLPSLLGPGEPSPQTWTYKCSESWKKTLCVSWSFPDGVPPGLMERVVASVLRDVYAVTQRGNPEYADAASPSHYDHRLNEDASNLRVHEILCWRTAFLLSLGLAVEDDSGETRESVLEIFAHLVDEHSPMCVAADSMSVGTRRVVVSGKGQDGDGGRKIWKGGFELVTKAVERVVREYGGLEFEKEGVCPECLASRDVRHASVWNWTQVRYASQRGDGKMRCREGHLVDTRLIGGFRSDPVVKTPTPEDRPGRSTTISVPAVDPGSVPAMDVIGGVVLVGLWDGKENKIIRAGTGFVVDKKRGLVVTASHTLMDMSTGSTAFGEDYYGLCRGKVVIGIIPENETEQSKTTAVFRYFADIVVKDPCHMDACVLKIKTRLEKDVAGDGSDCANQPEIPLKGSKEFKKEGLKVLKVSTNCEIEERVRILGYNQGGEGLVQPGTHLNRVADLAEGYVSKIFAPVNQCERPDELCPRSEIVVICPTIGGHSGGPCVNRAGEVIGILSRADPADRQRCYLVPASEFLTLVEQAKRAKRAADPMAEFRIQSGQSPWQ